MKLKFMLKFFIIITLTTFGYIIINSTFENIYSVNLINDFKQTCTEVPGPNKNIKFYNVSRETEKPAFKYEDFFVNPGAPLDIIIKLDSTFDLWVTPFINFFIGGHAALCTDFYDDGNVVLNDELLIETTYNSQNKHVFISQKYYWEDTSFTDSYIILRVKNLTEEDHKEILSKAVSMLGDPYNLTFIMNTKKTHYCSDLITKCFKVANKNCNYDGFATTVYDLLVSGCTEIVGYKEYDSKTNIKSYYGVNLSL